jgi:hypothetical protein
MALRLPIVAPRIQPVKRHGINGIVSSNANSGNFIAYAALHISESRLHILSGSSSCRPFDEIAAVSSSDPRDW